MSVIEHSDDGLTVHVDGVEYVRRDEYENLSGHRDRLRGERDTARERLRGAVSERDAAYRQRDRHYLALKLAVGAEAVGEWLERADAKRGQ